jgi:hypothetical protein
MIIQLNSDNNLTLHEGYKSKLNDLLTDELSRYSESITRVEVHLSDENGSKKGLTDKRCLLEARLQGRQPVAVTELADTHDNAVAGAIEKLKASLNTILGRLQDD